MSASVTDSLGTTTVCQPLQGQTDIGGGGTHLQTGWYTLLHLPAADTGRNCNDGGGTGDCHDNNLYFSCCLQVKPDSSGGGEGDAGKIATDGKPPTTHTVNIRLANSDGALAFYERSTIYIDSASGTSKNPLCTGHATP
jgi:hypothetical protein